MNFEIHLDTFAYFGVMLLLLLIFVKDWVLKPRGSWRDEVDDSNQVPLPKISANGNSVVATSAARGDYYVLNQSGLSAQLLKTKETLKANRDVQ